MFDVDISKWSRRKKANERDTEESLLFRYCREFGGVIFTEVPFGDKVKPKEARRVDAVRFLRHQDRPAPEIVGYDRKKFDDRLSIATRKGERMEVIEVKRELNRSVIGQVIVAKYLLEKEKERVRPEMVVICGEEVKLLKKFCDNYGIRVWNPNKAKLKQLTKHY